MLGLLVHSAATCEIKIQIFRFFTLLPKPTISKQFRVGIEYFLSFRKADIA